ncbi:site-specific integrase [Mesorhizobium sp.]|uniref:site-specific integrase n=1 Tax=Mesorhizobium sp. TaxID=1871066 RepID=UPI000FE2BCFB|nr:site-specific integrase [Mesorhizobium sp.]RWG78553.1 MAG: site-specific integrase [Mesorhizobium sp.]RWK22549.1 MAG: site-specific integrase [Mesorhizobium sp.]
MSNSRLTRDNPLLSRPKIREIDLTESQTPSARKPIVSCEINFTTRLSSKVAGYVELGLAESTRRAYAADLAHFEAWGGTIPASDGTVASYIADQAELLSVATLCRRLATISKAHTTKGLTSPTSSELVKATIKGIKRSLGTAQTEARPLLKDDLFAMLDGTGNDIKSIRDRALLLVGFAGGFRRSELVGLDAEDIKLVRRGIIVQLRWSKTDQLGAGRKIAIPYGRTRWCPVSALDTWLSLSAIERGALFRCIDRYGQIRNQRLSGEAVALVLRERLAKTGIDPAGYSGHSLRAGLVTSAAMAGASTWKIRAQTGHASDAMLARYVRDSDMFTSNAAGAIL